MTRAETKKARGRPKPGRRTRGRPTGGRPTGGRPKRGRPKRGRRTRVRRTRVRPTRGRTEWWVLAPPALFRSARRSAATQRATARSRRVFSRCLSFLPLSLSTSSVVPQTRMLYVNALRTRFPASCENARPARAANGRVQREISTDSRPIHADPSAFFFPEMKKRTR